MAIYFHRLQTLQLQRRVCLYRYFAKIAKVNWFTVNEPRYEKTGFLARLHEVQKSYCSHPGRTRSRSRSRSRSTLLKFSRSLYLGNHSSESIHNWTIGTQ